MQASVQLDTAPVDAPSAAVSAWQVDAGFTKAVRYLWWMLTRDDAVAYVTLSDSATT